MGVTSVEALYEEEIRPLPAAERLRLATIILNDISPHCLVDYRDEWTEEDLRDATAHSWRHIQTALGEEPDDS